MKNILARYRKNLLIRNSTHDENKRYKFMISFDYYIPSTIKEKGAIPSDYVTIVLKTVCYYIANCQLFQRERKIESLTIMS